MVLNEQQLQHYFREGYVLVPGLAPRTSVESVLEVAKQRLRNNHDRWQPTSFEHDTPEKDAEVHRLLYEPRVIEAVEQLLGNEPRVYYGMLAIVPARGGHGLPWHQDNQYSHLLPSALNCFIALNTITPDKGILWVAPRSHRAGRQESKEATDAPGHREAVVEPANGIALPTLQPGDACIFDRSTYHRSLRNETDEPRYAYAAQYMSDNGRRAETGEREPNRMRARDLERMIKERFGAPELVRA